MHKTDRSQGHPHLEDNLSFCDGQTASLDSIYAQCEYHQFLDDHLPKNLTEELLEILQPISIPHNTDPIIAALLAAINQTNALILQ